MKDQEQYYTVEDFKKCFKVGDRVYSRYYKKGQGQHFVITAIGLAKILYRPLDKMGDERSMLITNCFWVHLP